jgi:putative spermidine/putrescine transport system ATP-binding protein
LVLRGVGKGYGGFEERVLDGVSLEVGPGEIVAVVGQRWEGKTTLLELATGMLLADEGEVAFAGRDLASYSRRKRHRLLGREIVWLDRKESRLGLRVLDHVGLPLATGRGRRRRHVRRMAGEALERVGVAHVAEKRYRHLSSWERVLVGLAKAVIVKPQLLVVDDLLDALGPTRTQRAGDLLRSLVHEYGFAALIGVSDFEAALVAHRVLTFENHGLKLISSHLPEPPTDVVIPLRRRPSADAC